MVTPSRLRTRVAIADDAILYRDLLISVLDQHRHEIERIPEMAGNAEDAIRLVKRTRPDVVLLDLQMPPRRVLSEKHVRHGFAALREIRSSVPHTHVLVMSHTGGNPHDLGLLHEIYRAGVNGYLTKSDDSEPQLPEVIRQVMRGETFYSMSVRPIFHNFARLTEREAEVFQLLVAGATNQDIVKKLTIELGTVKTHVSNVLGKLDVMSREELRGRD